MVTIGEDTSGTPRETVDRAREASTDSHHSASERVLITSLDDQMCVVPLQRVVHQPRICAAS